MIYIAGPMTGLPGYNYPAFHAAERSLRDFFQAKHIINAAKLNKAGTSWKKCLVNDLKKLVHCDAMLVLQGWESSKGARLEVYVGKMLDMAIYKFDDDKNPTCIERFYPRIDVEAYDQEKSVALEAHNLVNGDRQSSYGTPEVHFSSIAEVWTVLFKDLLKSGVSIPPNFVALAMASLKLIRETNKHSRDNCVDGCGYLEIANRLSCVFDKQPSDILFPGSIVGRLHETS